jgi:hypothetical protein
MQPSGAGSAAGSLDRPNQAQADEPSDTPPSDPPSNAPLGGEADAGVAPAAPSGDDDEKEPPSVSPGPIVAACTDDGGNCLIVNIAVTDAGEDSCIQLALDNCGGSPQAGLPVRLPVSWRLGSASVTSSAEDCLPGAQFNPEIGSTVIDASGSITWNLTTRVPSEMVVDVTLEPASSALEPVRVTNSDLVEPLLECD